MRVRFLSHALSLKLGLKTWAKRTRHLMKETKTSPGSVLLSDEIGSGDTSALGGHYWQEMGSNEFTTQSTDSYPVSGTEECQQFNDCQHFRTFMEPLPLVVSSLPVSSCSFVQPGDGTVWAGQSATESGRGLTVECIQAGEAFSVGHSSQELRDWNDEIVSRKLIFSSCLCMSFSVARKLLVLWQGQPASAFVKRNMWISQIPTLQCSLNSPLTQACKYSTQRTILFTYFIEKTRREETQKKREEQAMQQRISQKAKGERTALNKRQGWEGTAIAGAAKEDGEDNENSHQDC